MSPLHGLRIVNLALNLPGPAAARRLRALGAEVIKVEPPSGDPMATYRRAYYDEMAEGMPVVVLDLKAPDGRARLAGLLAEADLLITSFRPSALLRLGLDPDALASAHPHLCQVAIVGFPEPRAEEAGHDLTYQASMGLVAPPALPRTLLSDLAGAEQATSAALALLLDRARTGRAGRATVALSDAAAAFAAPLRHGLTAPGALLGGGRPEYALYPAADGWVALAALEPHFRARVEAQLGTDPAAWAPAFAARPRAHWQAWAAAHDIPLEPLPG